MHAYDDKLDRNTATVIFPRARGAGGYGVVGRRPHVKWNETLTTAVAGIAPAPKPNNRPPSGEAT